MVARKLTERQKRFVEAYGVSGNATDAARKAGYSDPNKGRQLVTKGNVAAAIAAITSKRKNKAVLSRARRHQLLSQFADDPRTDKGHRIRSIELLMRADGEFAQAYASVTPSPPASPPGDGDDDAPMAPIVTFYLPLNGRSP